MPDVQSNQQLSLQKDELNPQITTVKIGRRNLTEQTLYPLSVPDQLKVTDIVTEAIQSLWDLQKDAEEKDEMLTNTAFASAIIGAIRANIVTVLALVIDVSTKEAEKVLAETTNLQLTCILDKIWWANYEDSIKNVQDLFGKVKSLFLSERSSQPSLNDTDNTISPTSTPEAGETED